MANLVVEEVGLYDKIEYNKRGLPIRGTPTTLPVTVTPDLNKFLVVRVKGDAGAYWLTIQVDAPQRLPFRFPNQYIVVKEGGVASIILPIPVNLLAVGTNAFRVYLAETEIARLELDIGYDPVNDIHN